MVYWRDGHKGITLPGNDVAVEKTKHKTCRFVESNNGLSLSLIVALSLQTGSQRGWKKIRRASRSIVTPRAKRVERGGSL